MKNKRLFIVRISAVLLAFSLLALVVGCASTGSANSEPVSLEGTWKGTRKNPDGSTAPRTIVFAGDTVHKVEQNQDYTFVQTATHITLTLIKTGETFKPQTYKVNGNTLSFGPGAGDQFWGGPYTKQ